MFNLAFRWFIRGTYWATLWTLNPTPYGPLTLIAPETLIATEGALKPYPGFRV